MVQLRTADFLDTLGVNTHIPYTDGGYANITNVINCLKYIGVKNVRDSISNGFAGSAPIQSYITIGNSGIKFTICPFVGGSHTISDIQSEVTLIKQLNTSAPNCVFAVEGPNEINNFSLSYNGIGGLQGAINLQKDLYSTVKANLPGVLVAYFTGYNAGSIGVGPNPATTSGLADFDTQHPYPLNGTQPLKWITRSQALGNENPPTGPALYTETGYTTDLTNTSQGGVNPDVQGKYILNLFLDCANQNITKTYVYQLLDAYAPGSPQGDDMFGLFDYKNVPKPAANNLHNLTTILNDSNANAHTFNLTSVSYSIQGLPTTGNTLLLQNSSGVNSLVVWNEPEVWIASTKKEINYPQQSVTVKLANTYPTLNVYDPTISATPIQSLTNANTVILKVSDHPVILQFNNTTGNSGNTTNTTPNTANTLTTNQQIPATLQFLDQNGNALTTKDVPVWVSSNTQVIKIVTNPGGQSANLVAVGPIGTANITATVTGNDVNNGTISQSVELMVIGGQIYSMDIILGTAMAVLG